MQCAPRHCLSTEQARESARTGDDIEGAGGGSAVHVGRGKGDYKLMTSYVHVGEGRGNFDTESGRWSFLDGDWSSCFNGRVWNHAAVVLVALGSAGLLYIMIQVCTRGFFLGGSGAASVPAPYSCNLEAVEWQREWSADKKAWCCMQGYIECDSLSTTKAAGQQWVAYTPKPSFAAPPPTGPPLPPMDQADMCPGSIQIPGYGSVTLVNAAFNKPNDPGARVEVQAPAGVVPHMKGRTYFASGCQAGQYNHDQYASFKLLGKTFKYSVDLSAAGCGCNAAVYLTSMQQNAEESSCSDYYCDANKVCGIGCAEIDIQEANRLAFYSTLHVGDDGGGVGLGYGAGRRNWNATVYGPGAKCIDTNAPFHVEAFFEAEGEKLIAMQVKLFQEGRPCELSQRIDGYSPFGRDGLAELGAALASGMTPIVSYWGVGESMLWMDGPGGDGVGPCTVDRPQECGDAVRFFDFSLA